MWRAVPLLCLAACAAPVATTSHAPVAAVAPTLICPTRGGAPWRQLSAGRFELVTDLPSPRALSILRTLEQDAVAIDAVLRTFVPAARGSEEHLRIVVFARKQDEAVYGGKVAAYYVRNASGWGSAPQLVLYASDEESTRTRLNRALGQAEAAHALPTAPPWVTAGLAHLMGTVRAHGETGRYGGAGLEVPAGEQAPTRVVLGATDPIWQGSPQDRTASALVGMLSAETSSYRARFLRLLALLHEGGRSDVAWDDAFRGVDIRTLHVELGAFRSPADERTVSISPPPPAAVTEETLPDGEVHLLWASLHDWRGSSLPAVHAQFSAAEKELGQSAAFLSAYARFVWATDGVANAKRLLAPVQDAQSADRRVVLATAYLFPRTPGIADRVLAVARVGDDHRVAAAILSLNGDRDRAVAAALRAVELNPALIDGWTELMLLGRLTDRPELTLGAARRKASLWVANGEAQAELRLALTWARAAHLPVPDRAADVWQERESVFATVTVTGRVVDERGVPVPAWVQISADQDWSVVHTRPDGTFRGATRIGDKRTLAVLPDDDGLVPEVASVAAFGGGEVGDIVVARVRWPFHMTAIDGIGPGWRGHAVVDDVDERLPAAQAGVRAGQRLWFINGHFVAPLRANAINALLAGTPGQEMKVEVSDPDGGNRRMIRFALAPE